MFDGSDESPLPLAHLLYSVKLVFGNGYIHGKTFIYRSVFKSVDVVRSLYIYLYIWLCTMK